MPPSTRKKVVGNKRQASDLDPEDESAEFLDASRKRVRWNENEEEKEGEGEDAQDGSGTEESAPDKVSVRL